MKLSMKKPLLGVSAIMATGLVAYPAAAAIDSETAFVFNTFSFLIHGVLVMLMAAGFAMLEAGLVRSKNTATICLKNVAIYSLAGIMFYVVGYNLMYMDVTGFFGSIMPWSGGGDLAASVETGYADESDWFFQMVFVATAASVVSGTLAERIKLWPFLAFVAVLTAVIYPIQGSWEWGGGWLNSEGFIAFAGAEFMDFAGSTLVHSVGGWAALTGAIILGARRGKFGKDGSVHPIPGANLPLATLGTFLLWFGWFGFNGGSQLALGSAADAIAISTIYINTNIAAAGGVMAAMVLTQLIYKKVDLSLALNGAIGGLVSITAGPDTPTLMSALLIGAVGGSLVVFFVPLLDKLKIDDVVGAISAHLVCGIWGTLAVPLTNDGATFLAQLSGVVAVGAFVIVASTITWMVLKATVGIRVSEEDEEAGLDRAELGLEAYPEFGRGSHTV